MNRFKKLFLRLKPSWLVLAWYDCWVGLFYRRDTRHLYIFPIPMVGVRIQCKSRKRKHADFVNIMLSMVVEEDHAQGLTNEQLAASLKEIGVFRMGCREEALVDEAIRRLEKRPLQAEGE